MLNPHSKSSTSTDGTPTWTSMGHEFYRKKDRIEANVISATNQKASFNLEPIEIRVGRKHMFLFSNLNFEKLKNQSSFTLWGILILIPWNQFWQNRSFRNWKNFYGDNQFSFDDKRREFVHSNYSLLHDLTWSRVEIRLVPELLVACSGYLSCSNVGDWCQKLVTCLMLLSASFLKASMLLTSMIESSCWLKQHSKRHQLDFSQLLHLNTKALYCNALSRPRSLNIHLNSTAMELGSESEQHLTPVIFRTDGCSPYSIIFGKIHLRIISSHFSYASILIIPTVIPFQLLIDVTIHPKTTCLMVYF